MDNKFTRYFKKNKLFFLIVLLMTSSTFGMARNNVRANLNCDTNKLTIAVIFSDGMVLQRDKPLSFWGKCIPVSKVMVSLNSKSNNVMSDTNGNWKLTLPAMKTGGPYELKVSDQDGNTISCKNVLIGDVYLCAGQSNMNFILAADANGSAEMATLNNTNIREFRCKMPDNIENPENKDHSKWIPAVGQNAEYFSAVAYYFAKTLQAAENIPIGIIVMSAGDTRAESWMAEEILSKNPELSDLDDFWKKHKFDNSITLNHRPSLFYNAVVKPVIHYKVKGVVWYQGESNTLPDNSGRAIADRAAEYKPLLSSLIQNWRSDRNDPALPFYIVQLPNYADPSGDIQWAKIRQAQLEVIKSTQNTGLAVTIDLGNPSNLHPNNKKPVGERLAFWVLGNSNTSKGEISGPIIKKIRVKKNKVTLTFDYTAGGLVNNCNCQLSGFEIADASSPNIFVKAEAYIKNDKVITLNSKVKNPVAVRYAWADNPRVSLYNKSGLPASPFIIKLEK